MTPEKSSKSKLISQETRLSALKMSILAACCTHVKHGYWPRNTKEKTLAFKRKCYRKVMRIGSSQKVTKRTLLQAVKQRKLQLLEHIFRMNDSRKVKSLVFTAQTMLVRYMLSSCVRPSICPSQVRVVQRWLNLGSHKQCHTIAQGL